MALDVPILHVLIFEVCQSLLPEFLIVFAFFSAVICAVMGRRNAGAGRLHPD